VQKKYRRFIYMAVVGVFISLLVDNLIPFKNPNYNPLNGILISIVITILAWEGNLRIDHWMEKKFPWEKKAYTRLFSQLIISIVYSASIIYTSMLAYDEFVCSLPTSQRSTLMIISVTVGVLISIIILLFEIGIQFFKKWRNSLIEIERYKTETLQAQLQNLKNQINPHFLFNNLSVLSSLVYKDQDKAVDFINQLSKVYRYILDNRNSELVTLQNELIFIESYIYLLQIRFDKNIQFKIEIEHQSNQMMIPPLALQILVENAIKHNEISSELPLHIHIYTQEKFLYIVNDLQLRSNKEPSSHTGLQNIKDRYKHFTNEEVQVSDVNHQFKVIIPLLTKA